MTPKLLLCWISILIIVIVLPAVFAPKKFLKALDALIKNHETVRVIGLVYAIISLLFLSVQSTFTGGRLILVPIIGYATAFRAILAFWFPGSATNMIKKVSKWLPLFVVIDLLIALGILYVAFYMI